MVHMQIKCSEGNHFKGYFPPEVPSGIKKKREKQHRRKCLYFLSGAVLSYTMSHCTLRVITCALSSLARLSHHFNNRIVDLSNTAFHESRCCPKHPVFLTSLYVPDRKLTLCCSGVKEL